MKEPPNRPSNSRRAVGWACGLGACALEACAPSLPDDTAHITEPRLIAVRTDPAEALPGEEVTAHALVAASAGTVMGPKLDWAICSAPKSPAENRIVNPSCLGESGVPVGEGDPVTFTVPLDACALFGPETPPGDFRPRDADATGGYFLPIRVRLDDSPAIVLERISCNPVGASIDVATAFREAYVQNRNPTLLSLTATVAGKSTPLGAIPGGSDVHLEVEWEKRDQEQYVQVDPETGNLAVRRETLRLSFYATSGTFEAEHTGSSGPTTSANTWHTTTDPGEAHLFVVLRDSRGGLDFSSFNAVIVKGTGK